MPEAEDPLSLAAHLAEDVDYWDTGLGPADEASLADLINRVLDKGVVITGDVTISVAGVDLVYLGLNAVLTSVSTARESLGRRVGSPARVPDADR
jgi:gas vesicle structural protein